MRIRVFALVLCLFLSACGFRPLYGTASESASVQASLGQIEIANIPDREGQYLRNALIDRFYEQGRPADAPYVLTIAPIEEGIADLDITRSADATRAQLRLTTRMSLRDRRTDAIVLDRPLSAITSYNLLQSQFTTRVTEEYARTNALDDLARQAETQLSLFFSRSN